MTNEIPDRYQQNPLLALIENYILHAIDRLEPEKVQRLSEIVARSFGGKPQDWCRTLRAHFQLPDDTDQTLKLLWKQCQEQSDLEQTDHLSPEDFAMQQADELFGAMGN